MESQSRDQIHIIEEEPPTKRQRQNDNHNISPIVLFAVQVKPIAEILFWNG